MLKINPARDKKTAVS